LHILPGLNTQEMYTVCINYSYTVD